LIIPSTFKIKGILAKEFLLHEAHNNTGHGGLQKTYSYLTEYYSWVDFYQDIQEFVASCNICQLTKRSIQLLVGLLTPLTVTTKLWDNVSIDFLYIKPITNLLEDVLTRYKPEKRNSLPEVTFQKLLVIQDRLTNFTFLVPCTIYIKTHNVIEI